MNTPRFGRRSSHRRAAQASKTSPPLGLEPASLDEVLVTSKLRSRRKRKANSYQENLALHALAKVMGNSPDTLIDALLEKALDLCCAGSAGLSLLETLPNGEEVFRWTNLAGEIKEFVGGSTPRNFSPCGVTLDRQAPQLFSHPDRRFQYLQRANIPIVEALVIPIYVGNEIPGTIWILSHDDECKFDSEDARVMTGLAEFTAGALRMVQACDRERVAREEGAKQIEAHKKTEASLRGAQANLSAIGAGSNDAIAATFFQVDGATGRRAAAYRARTPRQRRTISGRHLDEFASVDARLNELGEAHTARITDSLAMAELCTSEIRTISYLLHPPLLDEVGLASAISWYVEAFSQRSGIQVRLDIQDDIGRLPHDLENALFRIVQQSLANIHRHSGSKVAEIRINRDAESLVAEICDEGCGIPPEMLDGFHDGTRLVGVGMAGMRERIRDMGGHFEVRSSDNGTTIAVRLPMPPVPETAHAAGAV